MSPLKATTKRTIASLIACGIMAVITLLSVMDVMGLRLSSTSHALPIILISDAGGWCSGMWRYLIKTCKIPLKGRRGSGGRAGDL